jgi:hypothetical protein
MLNELPNVFESIRAWEFVYPKKRRGLEIAFYRLELCQCTVFDGSQPLTPTVSDRITSHFCEDFSSTLFLAKKNKVPAIGRLPGPNYQYQLLPIVLSFSSILLRLKDPGF